MPNAATAAINVSGRDSEISFVRLVSCSGAVLEGAAVGVVGAAGVAVVAVTAVLSLVVVVD